MDPVEQVGTGVSRNNEFVAGGLLTRLHENEPAFFEQAVLDLLMAVGYGGTQGKATRTQLSNDGGIDGIIDQDALCRFGVVGRGNPRSWSGFSG